MLFRFLLYYYASWLLVGMGQMMDPYPGFADSILMMDWPIPCLRDPIDDADGDHCCSGYRVRILLMLILRKVDLVIRCRMGNELACSTVITATGKISLFVLSLHCIGTRGCVFPTRSLLGSPFLCPLARERMLFLPVIF